jgi:hypothetical protein
LPRRSGRTRSASLYVLVLVLVIAFAGACSSSRDTGKDAGTHGAPQGDASPAGGDAGGMGDGAFEAAPGDEAGAGMVSISVSPVSVAVPASGSRSFTCTVTGSADTACTWSVTEPGGGTITPAGTYMAPAAAGTYHVVAASLAEPTATATATVTVAPQVVGGCSDLPGAGTWQNITPPTLDIAEWCTPYNGTCPQPGDTANGQIGTYGTNAFVLDPIHRGTVYLGTSSLGLWKSTDCGSSWVHIDTGTDAATIDAGRNWTMLIDPTNSQVLYTVAGYGQGGVYKSTNGGVDWTQILTQNILDATGATPCASTADQEVCGGFGAFMEKITMDPTDNLHLLAGFHSDCAGTTPLPGATVDSAGGWGCLAESIDGGTTWTLTTSAIPWSGLDGPGQTMIDAKTWFYGTNGPDGLWRTTTGGVSVGGAPAWTQVFDGSVNGSVYVATDGTYYSGGGNVIWSADSGLTWTAVPNSPGPPSVNGSTPMVDDGTTLYLGDGSAMYWTAPLASPGSAFASIASTPATPVNASTESPAAYVDYDASHHLLYSSNLGGGFWRFVTQ